ncbi:MULTISPECIES: XdhC family protein [Sphingobium]|uniref:XdhC family protein n=1 Tax=Sphingobium TaxID=165695 RepID=UPI0015ECB075|nr:MULTISPECIES: XdhC family protein [Sphingobium]MCW2362404.1 xanthine dehydrogenase accessory factor [Sphingobium sp. B10D3B]MCW2400917.1 xanthine dehydrogenase accessory factor [Sphingobium sp. B10D7B]MCW2407896.1 xanthine dehydrogenase accessory factor [Sphingobium xanthum]
MNDIDAIIAAARDWAGQPMALATVVEASGSAPRPRGGHMLIAADGRFAGSISGGCVEYDVFAMAERALTKDETGLRYFGSTDPSIWEPGLPCGGQIGVLVQPVSEAGFAPALFEAIAQGRAAGKAVAISTDLTTGKARLGTQAGQFVNLYEPARKLLIVGAVQIGQALAAIAQTLGMAVTVNDPRERFLSAERFPSVTLTDAWPDEAVASFAPNAACAVVTLSHDIKIDDPALIAALAQSTGYIGALGSRANHGRRLERLAAAGVSADDLRRVDGPAGLPIGGLGPQEIALSIAAGMVAAFRGTR